jgi:hypothetical protein
MRPKNKTIGYLIPVFFMCVFMLVIYGAYVPHKQAEIQRLVCIKFKPGTSAEMVEKHLRDFAAMKNSAKELVAYSAGHVQNSGGTANEFDVVHYLTFRTKESADQYALNADREEFVKNNEAKWGKVLEINSNIEK